MAEVTEADSGVPPATEQIHLPDPTYQPVLVALGLTIAIVGVVLSWVVFAIGMLIFLIATFRWIRSARADMAELPLSH
jgi:type IV secretory pathway TrbD component